jgi:hypothetical protein
MLNRKSNPLLKSDPKSAAPRDKMPMINKKALYPELSEKNGNGVETNPSVPMPM